MNVLDVLRRRCAPLRWRSVEVIAQENPAAPPEARYSVKCRCDGRTIGGGYGSVPTLRSALADACSGAECYLKAAGTDRVARIGTRKERRRAWFGEPRERSSGRTT